ncbi:unnamed protein product [Vicia faba]|uniref:Response regulatory domain-containing protein n=1 Tax=Vicia faba TaxID=3906 RepID=A0AAV0ZCY1_VICFA|nr:unnamed protein product [Vicia faba]
MPDMNSYHFLQHVTQQIRIPVIMMCVDQSKTPSLVMKAIEKGACGYWIKPLSEGQIKNIWQHVVRKVLKENNQHDQVLEILNVLKKKKKGRSSELHRTLHGFIVFEVTWNKVRGINYFNELQTDTSLAIEAKLMKRWEFDNIAQAACCMSSCRILLSGDLSERKALVEAEGISSDVSVCDKYLAKTAELLTSKCMTGCNRTGNKNTTTQSPFQFCNVLQKGKKRLGLKAFAETFKVIGNPLVIAKLNNTSSQIACPDVVFVDLTIYRNRELNFSQLGLHLCKFITLIKVFFPPEANFEFEKKHCSSSSSPLNLNPPSLCNLAIFIASAFFIFNLYY